MPDNRHCTEYLTAAAVVPMLNSQNTELCQDSWIRNCKKFIDGTYHGREERKQLHLEEFVY